MRALSLSKRKARAQSQGPNAWEKSLRARRLGGRWIQRSERERTKIGLTLTSLKSSTGFCLEQSLCSVARHLRSMPSNDVMRRGRDAPPDSPAGWRRGAGHSPKHLVVDHRDGVSKALHCKSKDLPSGENYLFYRFNLRSVSNQHSPSVLPGKRRNCLAARA